MTVQLDMAHETLSTVTHSQWVQKGWVRLCCGNSHPQCCKDRDNRNLFLTREPGYSGLAVGVCSAFVPSNISRSKGSHTLIAKYVGIPFVTAVFSLIMWGFSQETFPQERFSQECTKCSECGKTFTHSYLSGLIGSMLEKNPLSIRISESLLVQLLPDSIWEGSREGEMSWI